MFNPYSQMPLNPNNIYQNPYSQTPQNALQSNFSPKYEIIRVNGKNGAEALQMSPNSNVIVMDETAPMVWLLSIDGAGYKTVTPFDISPHKNSPKIDVNSLENRVSKLEELINEYQSNSNTTKRSRSTNTNNASNEQK